MILNYHKKYHQDFFKIPGFLEGPFLMFGYQVMGSKYDGGKWGSYMQLLLAKGAFPVTVLDYDDARADIHFDMNYPWDEATNLIGGYKVVCDIGCLEHVFNTMQAMENCMLAVQMGGLYALCTPVCGYHLHGFHTFNPGMLKAAFEMNGFKIEYEQYSTKFGVPLTVPQGDTLIWLVGRKVKRMTEFKYPVQDKKRKVFESRKTSDIQARKATGGVKGKVTVGSDLKTVYNATSTIEWSDDKHIR